MSNSESYTRTERKTTILRISKTPSSTTILDLAKELEYVKEHVVLIKRFSPRNFDTVNFFVEFSSAETCEDAKSSIEKKGGLALKGEKFLPFFASSDSLQGMKSVISENKLYVQYSPGTDHDELCKLFEGMKIVEPKDKQNFMFVVCNDQKEQAALKEKCDQKLVSGKPIHVNYAINKVRPKRRGHSIE